MSREGRKGEGGAGRSAGLQTGRDEEGAHAAEFAMSAFYPTGTVFMHICMLA